MDMDISVHAKNGTEIEIAKRKDEKGIYYVLKMNDTGNLVNSINIFLTAEGVAALNKETEKALYDEEYSSLEEKYMSALVRIEELENELKSRDEDCSFDLEECYVVKTALGGIRSDF